MPATHTRSAELPPVRLSYETLFQTIGRIRSLIRTANATAEPKWEQEHITLESGPSKLELGQAFTLDDFQTAPDVTLEMSYRYLNSEAAISRVEIRLSDFSRELTVSGLSLEQVESLANLIINDLRNGRSFLGGFGFRSAGGLFLIIVGILAPTFSKAFGPGPVQWALLLGGPALSISVWLLPWQSWFPGTAVYRGNVSFLVRHGPLVSFMGLLATLMTFALSVVFAVYLSRHSSTSVPQTETSPKGVQPNAP